MSLFKVFITRPLPACGGGADREACEVTLNPKDVRLPPAQVAAACREVEGLVTSVPR